MEFRWAGRPEDVGEVVYTPENYLCVRFEPKLTDGPGVFVNVESKYHWDDQSYGLIFHAEDMPYLNQLISSLVEARARLEGRF